MKFMQRAAASSPIASPSTPSTPEGPPLKRRKQGKDQEDVAFDVDELANQAKIRAVMEEEAAKQQALMDKVAAEAGESRWVLNFEKDQDTEDDATPIRVVQMGFADVDRGLSRRVTKSEEDDDDEIRERHDRMGRRSFGRFNRVIEVSSRSKIFENRLGMCHQEADICAETTKSRCRRFLRVLFRG